jgi:hypothetical protein
VGLLHRSNLTVLRLGGNALRKLNGAELSGDKRFCVVPHALVDGAAPAHGWELDPLTSLKTLLLENNRLVRLPEEFGLLTSLTMLNLSFNCLEELDGKQWGNLTNLTRLELQGNAQLRMLPIQLGWCDRLTWLDVVGCAISSPPPVVVQRGCRPIINYLRRVLDAQATRRLDLDGFVLLDHDAFADVPLAALAGGDAADLEREPCGAHDARPSHASAAARATARSIVSQISWGTSPICRAKSRAEWPIR